MKFRSLLCLLIFTIAMQSGIVLAEIHNIIPDSSPEHTHPHQDTDASSDALSDTQQASFDDCSGCCHNHCSHFIALSFVNESSINALSNPSPSWENAPSITSSPSSQYRPPKA